MANMWLSYRTRIHHNCLHSFITHMLIWYTYFAVAYCSLNVQRSFICSFFPAIFTLNYLWGDLWKRASIKQISCVYLDFQFFSWTNCSDFTINAKYILIVTHGRFQSFAHIIAQWLSIQLFFDNFDNKFNSEKFFDQRRITKIN